MHLQVIDQKRKKLLPKLAFLNKYGFYLAGGTALALQMGHRTSVDFDFYSQRAFNAHDIIQELKKISMPEVFMIRENTLGLTLDGVEVTLLKYPYKLIFPPLTLEGVKIASIEDIAAMKVVAIIQRGTKRDFIDIYYLLNKYPLLEILRWTHEKYPEISSVLCLKGLVYFEDAEEDKKSDERIKMFDKNFSWPKAKKFIEKKVFDFQKESKHINNV